MTYDNNTPLQINLKKILSERIPPAKRKWIPTILVSLLEKTIRQDRLNEILRNAHPLQGSAFAENALRQLDIHLDIVSPQNIPESGRWVFASNHPLGGLDGIALIKTLGEIYGDDNIRFLVNDMLMNVVPLRNTFLPINKYGSQARNAAVEIDKAYHSDKQIIIFPAGLVSRIQKDGSIKDLEWHKAFVQKAIQSGRGIIPIHFRGLNSPRFYKTALWRKRLGIKVNIEQAFLPAELCNSQGKHFSITFGRPISHEELAGSPLTPARLAQKLRSGIYSL